MSVRVVRLRRCISIAMGMSSMTNRVMIIMSMRVSVSMGMIVRRMGRNGGRSMIVDALDGDVRGGNASDAPPHPLLGEGKFVT